MRIIGTLLVFFGLAGTIFGFVLAFGLRMALGAALVFFCLALAALGSHLRN